jgi:DNA-binding transcriptional MocR family regulator
MAEQKGLKLHHLGAGYPHPEVSDPTAYIAQRDGYFRHLAGKANPAEPDKALAAIMRPLFSYTDTLGPATAREAFARVYGHDFDFTIDPDLLVPTVGSTGGIALLCSLFERTGRDVAYLVDAPTYTGFLTRAQLYRNAHFYSVDLDKEGPDPEALRGQIRAARRDGYHVAFYYTVPDGHNPGGISFSQPRRDALMKVVRDEGIFVVEDAPYTYISYESAESRPRPFVAMDPEHTVHLFTASKIGLPGPRVGFLYSQARLAIAGGREVGLKDLALVASAGDILLHNPEALRGFEAYLMDESFAPRESLWPIAALKNAVYGENRDILLGGLEQHLGEFPDEFSWTRPGAGFFSVFTIKRKRVRTDSQFIEDLIAKYGVVTIPMFGFLPADAKVRDPDAGLDQIRLSFCFNERLGEGRRQDLRDAVRAFANAMRVECGLPALG